MRFCCSFLEKISNTHDCEIKRIHILPWKLSNIVDLKHIVTLKIIFKTFYFFFFKVDLNVRYILSLCWMQTRKKARAILSFRSHHSIEWLVTDEHFFFFFFQCWWCWNMQKAKGHTRISTHEVVCGSALFLHIISRIIVF